MGAEPYLYVVDYQKDVQAALDKLRAQVFASGEFRGADLDPATAEDALAAMEADGTASILDIFAVTDTPELGCAAPLTREELERYFGTVRPTRKMVEDNEEFWEELERGEARYVVLYERDWPKSLLFVGYSFD